MNSGYSSGRSQGQKDATSHSVRIMIDRANDGRTYVWVEIDGYSIYSGGRTYSGNSNPKASGSNCAYVFTGSDDQIAPTFYSNF